MDKFKNKDNFYKNYDKLLSLYDSKIFFIHNFYFELIIEKEQQFTPDLYLCYKTFSKYYPTKETQMRQALDYFLNPITDLKTLEIFINQFGNWLEKQLQNH